MQLRNEIWLIALNRSVKYDEEYYRYQQYDVHNALFRLVRPTMTDPRGISMLGSVRKIFDACHLELDEVKTKIEQYITELKTSGYSMHQSREIIISGIRGWRNKIRKRKRQNVDFYRLAEDTIEARMNKEIVEKENWYKTKNDDEDDEMESPSNYLYKLSSVKCIRFSVNRTNCTCYIQTFPNFIVHQVYHLYYISLFPSTCCLHPFVSIFAQVI